MEKVGWVKRSIGWVLTVSGLYIFYNSIEFAMIFLDIDLNGYFGRIIVGIAGLSCWFFFMAMMLKFDLMYDHPK
jgi:hypothetical protein